MAACSSGRCCRVLAGCPRPVHNYCHGGGEERGCDCDEGDLPARHAADDDGVQMGRCLGWPGRAVRGRFMNSECGRGCGSERQ